CYSAQRRETRGVFYRIADRPAYALYSTTIPLCHYIVHSMLNTLWLAFFIIASISGLYQWVALQDTEIFSRMVLSLFNMAELSVELMVLLFGTLTLWLGFLRIAEAAGLIETLSRLLAPLFGRLMPGVPAG